MQGDWFALCISVEAISDENFREEMFELLQHSNLSPEQIRFEIGEEELYKFPNWKKHLSKLREQGFGIIISHFGKSIQSILNMAQMPIDAIKLETSTDLELLDACEINQVQGFYFGKPEQI